jgi:hypothetical protein
MAIKNVLIVARTRMFGARVCVGALSATGENLRLMNRHCLSDAGPDSPYKIGEWWKVTCEPCGPLHPPHTEDVAVTEASRIGEQTDLASYLMSTTKPWRGPIEVLFDGNIRFTGSGAGYISRDAMPPGATGFWIPDSPLKLDVDSREKPGYYTGQLRHLSYVGLQEEVGVIQVGQLVRISLARWWKPRDADPSFEDRCYAQLSGWY